MHADRRNFLGLTSRLAAWAALAVACPGAAALHTDGYPFSLGVASGSPRPTSVVLWTRILADPLQQRPLDTGPLAVRWEIAADERFAEIVAQGSATAIPELAHSVHVDVTGLQPDRWYWYRFMLGAAVSPIGRTRTADCTERLDPTRSLLGKQQETWLAQGMADAAATSTKWNFLAQQTLMAQASQTPIAGPNEGRFWTDGWDGYPAARQRLFDDLLRYRPANPVVLSGDVHTFYAADLRPDFMHAASAANPVIATEFCGTSISSSARPQARIDQYLSDNPHLKFGRSDRRGFVMIEVTPATTQVRFQALDDVSKADSGLSTIARFDVEDGLAGVVRAS